MWSLTSIRLEKEAVVWNHSSWRKASYRQRDWRTGIFALALALVGSQAALGGKPGSCTDAPVTTYFSDLDSNGLPSDIASDGLGGYPDNVNGVTSFLTCQGYNGIGLGDWQFSTLNTTARRVNESIDPDDAVQPGDPHYTAPANPPFWGTLALPSHVEVKCTLVNNDMLTMTPGSSFSCPLLNRFQVSGVDYWLSPDQSFSHLPEITDALVRCNTADAGGCNDWFIDPPAGMTEAVGRLTVTSTGGGSKGHTAPVNDGDFYLRFHIHITRP